MLRDIWPMWVDQPYVVLDSHIIREINLEQSSSASFFNGSRFVHFTNAGSISGPSMFDKARSFIEQRIGTPICWWPLPPVQYSCPTGSTRIEWKVGGRDHLYIITTGWLIWLFSHSGAHKNFMLICPPSWSRCTKRNAARLLLRSHQDPYCLYPTPDQAPLFRDQVNRRVQIRRLSITRKTTGLSHQGQAME